MSPRQHRIALQIKWLIDDTSGECTLREMARFTRTTPHTCRAICAHRGWGTMYRRTGTDMLTAASNEYADDLRHALSSMGVAQ